jgi:DNA repair exonuclease SbcCD ATPase subunit
LQQVLTDKLKLLENDHANSLSNRKSDLRSKKNELSNLKESEQEKVTEIDRLTGLYKEVNMMHKRSSADIHLLSTRCHNLNNENQKLVAIPKAVRSNKFVTISKADYVAYSAVSECSGGCWEQCTDCSRILV